MGFVSSLLGGSKGAGFQAQQDPNAIANLQAQQGVVANNEAQLQDIANGGGPNPALAQLQATTGQNIQNAAGLVASQKGLNPALAARLAGMQAGQLNQQAANQAAGLSAQQQLGAIGQIGNEAIGQQGVTQQGLSSANAGNSQIANTNASSQAGGLGGLLGAAGTVVGSIYGGPVGGAIGGKLGSSIGGKAHGGMIGYADGGNVAQQSFGTNYFNNPFQPIQPIAAYQNPSMGMGGNSNGGAALQQGTSSLFSSLGQLAARNAPDNTPSPNALPQWGNTADDYKNLGTMNSIADYKGLPDAPISEKDGGNVPGKPLVKGDSYKNDIVTAKLSPGEIVIPNHILQSSDPIGGAAEFVRQELAKKKEINKPNFSEGGMAQSNVLQPDDNSGTSDNQDVINRSPADIVDSSPAPQDLMSKLAGVDATEADKIKQFYAPQGPSPFADPGDSVAKNNPAPTGTNDGVAPNSQPDSSAQLGSQPGAMGLSDVYQKELKGIQQQTAAQSQLAKDNMQLEQQHQQALQMAQDNWNKTSSSMQANLNNALDDIKNGHINPRAYLENMGTGDKITTAIGLILGGFGGGLMHQANPAQQYLDQQINRDIEAQKNNLGNKATVFNAYMDQFKNAAAADQMTRATQLGIYASRIREAAAKSGSPMAIAQGNIQAAELEQKMIPLMQNGQLIQHMAGFNGGGAESAGSEAQFQVGLNAAQRINPGLYKDQQDKYVPGIGVASHPVAPADRERLTNLNALIPLVDRAIADQKKYGYLGASLGAHPIRDPADAAADKGALNVSLNKLTGLNRLNDREYQNYGAQIGNIGSMNLGAPLETLTKLRSQAIMDRNSAIGSAGIKQFSDAKTPSGLTGRAQQNLDTFLKNNPKVDPGTAQDILRKKGLI